MNIGDTVKLRTVVGVVDAEFVDYLAKGTAPTLRQASTYCMPESKRPANTYVFQFSGGERYRYYSENSADRWETTDGSTPYHARFKAGDTVRVVSKISIYHGEMFTLSSNLRRQQSSFYYGRGKIGYAVKGKHGYYPADHILELAHRQPFGFSLLEQRIKEIHASQPST